MSPFSSRPSPLTAVHAASLLAQAAEAGRSAVAIQLVDDGSGAPSSLRAVLLEGEPELTGSLGNRGLDLGAKGRAEALLDQTPGPSAHQTLLEELDLEDGNTARLYLEVHHPPDSMVIVGAGHIAQPLAALGSLMGMAVSVLDDRPEWASRERFPDSDQVLEVDFSDPFRKIAIHRGSHVVLVTRGHRYDYECLLRILQHHPEPAYIGMIGSRRRVRATFAQLGKDGIPPEAAARVRAPIGLDIGAQTPAEIAIAVAAEIVQSKRGGTGIPLTEREQVAQRFMRADAEKMT
jgi:xanthine dehydrogenase accessory factor